MNLGGGARFLFLQMVKNTKFYHEDLKGGDPPTKQNKVFVELRGGEDGGVLAMASCIDKVNRRL